MIGESRSSSWTGRISHCQKDGSARLGDAGHHAGDQIGRRRDVVAQAASSLIRFVTPRPVAPRPPAPLTR